MMATDVKILAISGDRLIEVVRAVTAMDLVIPFPECGNIWWFASALIIGQGDLTGVTL